jgi:hypothetical protein
MYIFVEEKIRKAVEEGEFKDLPGMGKPLDFRDDLPGLSPELKMGFKILKNAGYLPEKSKLKRSDVSIHDLLFYATDVAEKGIYQKRLQFEELAHEKKWYHQSTFKKYANKIYRKLFN